MSDANEKKGAQPPNNGELGAKPAGAGREEQLQDQARADMRAWLVKLLLTTSREYELGAYKVGKW
jgi:hypothetical protein